MRVSAGVTVISVTKTKYLFCKHCSFLVDRQYLKSLICFCTKYSNKVAKLTTVVKCSPLRPLQWLKRSFDEMGCNYRPIVDHPKLKKQAHQSAYPTHLPQRPSPDRDTANPLRILIFSLMHYLRWATIVPKNLITDDLHLIKNTAHCIKISQYKIPTHKQFRWWLMVKMF